MDAVLGTVYHCLPPPILQGSDLPCYGGGGKFVLSKLPPSIQWEIVGRLPLKDAMRLSVLSHYWYNFLLPERHGSATERRTGDQHKEIAPVGKNRNQDRISFLPDCLRRNIVGRLPIRDAVRTAILSRRWLNDWSSTPLHLDDGHLIRSAERDRVQRVSRILMAHPGPFSSIRLCFTAFGLRPGPDALRLWISLLADKCVEDLVLVNRSVPVDQPLPPDLLRCNSLRRLCLGFFRFPSTTGHPRVIYSDLTKIHLYCVVIDTTDLHYLVCSCPMLNSLCIVCSYGRPDIIQIHGHSCLQSIVIWSSVVSELSVSGSSAVNRLIMWNNSDGGPKMTLKIGNAPSLELLGYLMPGHHKLVINNIAIKAGTKANIRSVVPTVMILGCKLTFGDRDQGRMLPAFLRCFPHVETLHIQSVDTVNPAGKLNLTSWLTKGDDIECVDHHLKKLFFHNFHGERSEMAFLKFVWMKARFLEVMVIIPSAKALVRKNEIDLKLRELGCSVRASKEPHLLVIETDIPMTFNMASDASVIDPFYSMDEFVLVTDEDDQKEVEMVTPMVELSSGHMMPVLGLTMGHRRGIRYTELHTFINYALQDGFRHFDLTGDLNTAAVMCDALAEACKKGTVKREDLYICIKLYLGGYNNFIDACKHTLGVLQLDYIDLCLLDRQTAFGHHGFSWDDVALAVSEGLIRGIGLSNWNIRDMKDCLANNIHPTANLVEITPYLQRDSLVDFCHNNGILVMAMHAMDDYLTRSSCRDDPDIKSWKTKYGKTTDELIIRWLLQRGAVVVIMPKISRMVMARERDCLFPDVFDFQIASEDMEAMRALDRT